MKAKKGNNKYTKNSYNIYITILVGIWKMCFRNSFSVTSCDKGQRL